MKISRIDIHRIAIPFSAGERHQTEVKGDDTYNAASPNISKMESLMVRVVTECGLEGWGEAFGHGLNPVTYSALESLVAPFFLGADLDDYQQHLYQAKRAFHSFGSTGPMLYALSAIDTAVWDIRAKAEGKPLYQLLGGSHGKIELYASLVSYGNDPEEVARQVHRVYQRGFRSTKLHETAVAAIRSARSALPDDAELMVDVNCPWFPEEAIRQASQLRDLDLTWLEEPVWPPDNLTALARVRATGVAISAGENASGVAGFEQLFSAGAVDVAQPSVAKIGGVTGMLEVQKLAANYGIRLVPHCFYYGPGMLAAAHIVAAMESKTRLEVPLIELAARLHPLHAFTPTFDLGTEHGLGFAPDPELLEKYRVESRSLQTS